MVAWWKYVPLMSFTLPCDPLTSNHSLSSLTSICLQSGDNNVFCFFVSSGGTSLINDCVALHTFCPPSLWTGKKKNESQKQVLKDSKDTYLTDQGSTCEEKRQKDSNRGEIWQNFSAQFLLLKKKKKAWNLIHILHTIRSLPCIYLSILLSWNSSVEQMSLSLSLSLCWSD